ncbi:MAG TPA: hypothetical protein VNA30_05310 [Mycobacteriales bacterium]|nr:hypothetical protein [Mycobacteriales bacterium]
MRAPGPVAVARAVLLVEGVVLALLGLAYGVAGIAGEPFDRLATLLQALATVLTGCVLVLLARFVGRRKAAAKAPAVVLHLLALPVGFDLSRSERWPYGVVVLLFAVGGLVAVVRAPLDR